MASILEISTEKGRLKSGQFITYKGDEDCTVYDIVSVDKITCFYPSEDGTLITIDVKDNYLIF
ncbi:hypothetical protein Phi10:1_gp105 [Cellulophaga phage phi10:1]|uniref:Uncharacterized protein n=1 Tax=Cellulophaga phage phi10:1 TaxID=1327981 RepID=S0A0W3_9CAUD|nr:hypothetical protein Phi10:1_gp105 [Cellulophaga phage phi10:1]AGO48445.1 hypothetical protein Phi10:1_gp105 [Cellulophaga phage phi10:1]